MTNTKIICSQTEQQFDYDTNRYVTLDKVIKVITEEKYNNMTAKEALNFF